MKLSDKTIFALKILQISTYIFIGVLWMAFLLMIIPAAIFMLFKCFHTPTLLTLIVSLPVGIIFDLMIFTTYATLESNKRNRIH